MTDVLAIEPPGANVSVVPPSPHPILATLPGIYQREGLVQAMCEGIDSALAPVLSVLDAFAEYLDPMLCPEDLLGWLGGWIGVVPLDTQARELARALVRTGAPMRRAPGTLDDVATIIAAMHDVDVEATESGATAWSTTPDSDLPGSPAPNLRLRISGAAPGTFDARALDALLGALVPAHVPRTVDVD